MTTEPVHKKKVELWDINKVLPYAGNAKKHPEAQIAKLAKSIKKFGIANPLNVKSSGEIITGHGRRLAALSLGWLKIPVIVRDDLSDAEADALRISDNQTTSTDYDTELLQQSLNELAMDGFEMDTLGFDEKEIERMTSDFGTVDDDMFVEDITAAVETQKEENVAKEAEIDGSAAPVSDALGFKRVTVEQSRKIRELMLVVESKTGKMGVDALLAVLEAA